MEFGPSDYAARFIDASTWFSKDWLSTGGTRFKRVLVDDEGKEWYFKCSEKKEARNGMPEKYYKYEFWSEVIAHQVGKFLGLDVLRYDVAVHGNEMGCISPLMVGPWESLIEIGRFMTAINPDFLPEDNASRKEYTFQLLHKTISHFELTQYWPFFFKTIIFDALIGNTDRHQENWAFIRDWETTGEESLQFLNPHIKAQLLERLATRFKMRVGSTKKGDSGYFSLSKSAISRAAPIYDSGSSLGRELTDERVITLLSDDKALDRYIQNGCSEIHWDRKKITHFDLIGSLLNSEHKSELSAVGTFLRKWDDQAISDIVYRIDNTIPDEWRYLCIPRERKELIVRLLVSRAQKLIRLFDV